MTELNRAKKLLASGGYTCVLVRGEEVITCTSRGVAPLVDLIADGKDLTGFTAADKVVGKAVAMLAVYAGIRAVYADNMGKSAVETLTAHGVEFSYGTLADRIINRDGTDICPMEKTVERISSPQTAYEAVRAKLYQLRGTK